MLWYVIAVTFIAGIFDPMWFVATVSTVLIACLPVIFGKRD